MRRHIKAITRLHKVSLIRSYKKLRDSTCMPVNYFAKIMHARYGTPRLR